MADVKISALPAASTPLAGTEVLPIVQGGTTDKVSVANLTAGRTVDAAAVVVGTGNVSVPSVTFSGDTNTGIYSPAADTIAFSEGGVEAMRITPAGDVGIGTTTPGYRLHVFGDAYASNSIITPGALYSDNGATVSRVISAGGISYWGTTTSHPVVYQTNNTERMRIDASGNVGIGTSSPAARLDVSGDVRTNGTVQINKINSALDIRPGASDFSSVVWRSDNGLTTYANIGPDTAGSGSLWVNGATNIFLATGNTERARITTGGDLLVGTTSSDARVTSRSSDPNIAALGTRGVSGDLGTPHMYITKFDNNTTTAQVFIRFVVNNGAVPSGQINANGANAAAFGTWSDARLKENIVDLPSQLENICALRPVEFDYKDGSGHQVGFIAQEMQAVYPDVVAASNDEMLQVTGWSKTEARIVKALQELKAENDALKARVAALEVK